MNSNSFFQRLVYRWDHTNLSYGGDAKGVEFWPRWGVYRTSAERVLYAGRLSLRWRRVDEL